MPFLISALPIRPDPASKSFSTFPIRPVSDPFIHDHSPPVIPHLLTPRPAAVPGVRRGDGAAAALVRPHVLVEPCEAVLELPVLLDLLPDHQRGGDGVADRQHQEQDAQRQHLMKSEEWRSLNGDIGSMIRGRRL